MNAPAQIVAGEEWRVIAEFPVYAVSSLGRVMRSVAGATTGKVGMLKQNTIHGYKYVGLSRDGVVYSRRVNRLVCIAFHGDPPSPKHHAAHDDNDRANNRKENVRWATGSENMLDKSRHGTAPVGDRNGARKYPERLARGLRNGKHTKPERTPRGEAHGRSCLTESQVREIRADSRSRRAIAAAYGVSKFAIDGIKTGKTWGHVA